MSDEEEGGSRRAKNYSQDEEIQVCRSWMHISQDPIVGVQQNKTKFWERIEDDFKKAMFKTHGVPIQPRGKGKSIFFASFIYMDIVIISCLHI